jgi:hypothetical protein
MIQYSLVIKLIITLFEKKTNHNKIYDTFYFFNKTIVKPNSKSQQ